MWWSTCNTNGKWRNPVSLYCMCKAETKSLFGKFFSGGMVLLLNLQSMLILKLFWELNSVNNIRRNYILWVSYGLFHFPELFFVDDHCFVLTWNILRRPVFRESSWADLQGSTGPGQIQSQGLAGMQLEGENQGERVTGAYKLSCYQPSLL